MESGVGGGGGERCLGKRERESVAEIVKENEDSLRGGIGCGREYVW